MRRLLDFGLLMACNLIWASQFALVKLVQAEVGPVFATAIPMLMATLLLFPLVARGLLARWRSVDPEQRVRRGDLIGFVLIGVLGQVAGQLFVTWGVRHSLAANAALLQLALPVVTAAMAFFILGERMTRARSASFALALLGVVACSMRDLDGFDLGGDYLLGNALIFGGVMGSAFYNVFSKKMLERWQPLEVLFGSYVFVCVVLVPLAVITEPASFAALPSLSGRSWLGLLLLAGLQYFLSMVLFLTVLTRVSATQAALSNYLIPFFGVVLAFVILHERLSVMALVGGALVLLSTVLATVFDHRAPTPLDPNPKESFS